VFLDLCVEFWVYEAYLHEMCVNNWEKLVDVAIVSLEERFKTLAEVKEEFAVLVNFPKIKNVCETLSGTLSNGGQSDLVGKQLALEMRSFPDLPSTNKTTMEIPEFYHEKRLQEIWPNVCVCVCVCVQWEYQWLQRLRRGD